jgi:hypothetical protein
VADGAGNEGARGTTRRRFLKTASAAAAAAAATAAAQASAATATHRVGASASGTRAGKMVLSVDDYVDGLYVLSAATPAVAERMPTGTSPITLSDGLKIEVTSGHATVRQDRYTGAILLKPSSGEAVEARAFAPAGSVAAMLAGAPHGKSAVSEVTNAGYDATDIPRSQLQFAAVGGGSCPGQTSSGVAHLIDAMARDLSPQRRSALETALGSEHKVSLRVRAAVLGNVIPLTPAERTIVWRFGRYYGDDKLLGLMRLTYSEARRSVLTMTGKGAAFFPASGINSNYYLLDMLDLGKTGFSTDPMLFPAKTITWPVCSTPMHLAKPVTFYDESDPKLSLFTINSNTMDLYDYHGAAISRTRFNLSKSGVLRATYNVTNQTATRMTGRWMLVGEFSPLKGQVTDAVVDLGPAGSATATKSITVEVSALKSELTQTVAFAIMSLSDPVIVGINTSSFKYPGA